MYKLISLDNKTSAGQALVGKSSSFIYDGIAVYFDRVRTSTVKNINVDGDKITVVTRNSTYVFKKEESV